MRAAPGRGRRARLRFDREAECLRRRGGADVAVSLMTSLPPALMSLAADLLDRFAEERPGDDGGGGGVDHAAAERAADRVGEQREWPSLALTGPPPRIVEFESRGTAGCCRSCRRSRGHARRSSIRLQGERELGAGLK